MTADNTIRQQAHRLVSAHGVDAPIQAAMRAQAFLDRGNRAGSVLWGRIGNMTNVLLLKSAEGGTGMPAEPAVDQIPSLSDLPPPNIKRWHFQHKAIVVTAVRMGLINVAEACARYGITIEEFLSWKRLLDQHGIRGLRATCLQNYRRGASGTSGSIGHSEAVKAQGSGS